MEFKNVNLLLEEKYTEVDISDLSKELIPAAENWHRKLQSIYMNGVDGAPDWLEFEHRIWTLGERLRHYLKSKNKLGKSEILDQVESIIRDRKYGKGRQTLVLLLGDFGKEAYTDVLAISLDDEDIYGHALKALTKARIKGFGQQAEHIMTRTRGWIKKAAKNYCEKIKDE